MGAFKKLVFVGALAAAGAVVAKKLMDSSSENAWESAGGWDSTSSTDWSRKASDAASTVSAKADETAEAVSDAADEGAAMADEAAEQAADTAQDVADSVSEVADEATK